jgi:general secretion pathway protein G
MQEDETKQPRRKLPLGVWIAIAGAVLVFGLVVLGILATLVVPNVLQKFNAATREKAMADVMLLDRALEEYALSNAGRYPESLEELVTPDINGHTYIEGTKLPTDPWGNAYLYDPPSSKGDRPTVYTLGKDGRRGGAFSDTDTFNHTSQSHP